MRRTGRPEQEGRRVHGAARQHKTWCSYLQSLSFALDLGGNHAASARIGDETSAPGASHEVQIPGDERGPDACGFGVHLAVRRTRIPVTRRAEVAAAAR